MNNYGGPAEEILVRAQRVRENLGVYLTQADLETFKKHDLHDVPPLHMKTNDAAQLLQTLQSRFERHMPRHPGIFWADVQGKLESRPEIIRALAEMERTGGEPDLVDLDERTGEFRFFDCSPESPIGRRSLCYDREGLASRKSHSPAGSALELAAAMGIELLTEADYLYLQTLGCFDRKSSSWLRTPPALRAQGGALFGDFRYGLTFVYYNGAQSYYAVRGFRGAVRV